ncbi:hypothetical protein ZEAMMB73_Zm00001d028328 [Zea mays]|uniref:Uncharacterized protein n=1 Tax=Zea mays TaxID=4577 RepID=A0A1D6JUD2_MAIZE|nr:hypothetical protein ZEAMMB73_Zm00001d028328 [Zea mays]
MVAMMRNGFAWVLYCLVAGCIMNLIPTQGSLMNMMWLKAVNEMEQRLLTPSMMARDLKVAVIYAVLFCFLMVSCYAALYLKWFRLSAMFVTFGILLPVSLKISRHRRLKRKRERRLLLPLSM